MMNLKDSTVDLLKQLIQFNTVNPPGNELAVQQFLASLLQEAGFEVELIGAQPERPNLLARLRAGQPGETLCFLGHIDTVLANPQEWEHDPWSGKEVDGFIWGRGALDMKGQVAAEVAAAVALAKSGWRPKRGELLIAIVVDEETGGGLGARWLCEQHPEKVRCDYLINEGGGTRIPYAGEACFDVSVGEKGVFQFSLQTSGVAGHGSTPELADNALVKLTPALQALTNADLPMVWTETSQAMFQALGISTPDPQQAAATLREQDSQLAALLVPALQMTVAPTRIRASEKINVIPSQASLQVDCRVPAGMREEVVREHLSTLLGGFEDYELTFLESVVGNSSPTDTLLMDEIHAWLKEQEPQARCVPTVMAGYTDSHVFRTAFPDVVAYGFCPHRVMSAYEEAPLIHGANERVATEDLRFSAEFFFTIAQRILG